MESKLYLLDRQVVGIWTVLKSSEVSSLLVVPIKSNNKQFKLNCNKCDNRSLSCNFVGSFGELNNSFIFLFACFNKLHDNVNISSSWVSLNELEIFLCLVKDRLISVYKTIILMKSFFNDEHIIGYLNYFIHMIDFCNQLT